jgi:flavorubredoxin
MAMLKPGVLSVGAKHYDRRLFDELIPLPEGTTYNAYLVRGSRATALIDTVDPEKESVLFDCLTRAGVESLDYVVCNHAEQDHSGAIPAVLKRFPAAKLVVNPKCAEFVREHLLVPAERMHIVQDRATLDLGGQTMEFIFAPWVHWPETMLTYLREDAILFPCDLFGAHLAQSETFVVDDRLLLDSAKRYYAEIMMPFRAQIRQHLATLSGYRLEMIAPSHGPVHRRPSLIIDAYTDWVSDRVANEVVLPYVSMHGSTKRLVEVFTDELAVRGVEVRPFNLTVSDIGELAMALVDAATVVIATPTVLTGPHPLAVSATYLVNALRPKTRFVGVINSFGWGGRTVEVLTGMLTALKAEILTPVTVRGYPKEADYAAVRALADGIATKHTEMV